MLRGALLTCAAVLATVVAATRMGAAQADPRTQATAFVHPYAVGPPLTALNEKLSDPSWLVAWLLQPSRLRPRSLMRNFNLRVDEAQAVAAYLYPATPVLVDDEAWRGGDVATGQGLFVSRGCRACHTIGATQTSGTLHAPDLAGIGLKVRADWLFNWIESPRRYDPDTPMPQLALSQDDIRHLVAFLMSHREGTEALATAPQFVPESSEETAREVITRFDCSRCHLIRGFQTVEPVRLWPVSPKACGNCHGSPDSPAPRLGAPAPPTDEAERILLNGRQLIAYYNCRGCHRIEGHGGEIADHLERKTFAPPTLEGEGARVQTSWLIDFLERPKTLRPWLQMRMPDYGLSNAEATALARYFAALAQVPAVDDTPIGSSPEMQELGGKRFEHFKCTQCHAANFGDALSRDVDLEDLSIDLGLAKERLRPSWIRGFLATPKALVGTETRMPTVFYTIDGVSKVDDPQRDIEAITQYLLVLTQPPPASAAGSAATREDTPIDWATYPY